MKQATSRAFTPLKFGFNPPSDGPGRFYIYAIWNRLKDKYYVGISRTPATRINQHLKKKAELCEDYARAAQREQLDTGEEKIFQFFLLKPETGYQDALIGCVAEVLHMEQLEKKNKLLYNKNKFGGHHSIKGEERAAFYAIVKIIYPGIAGPPTSYNM